MECRYSQRALSDLEAIGEYIAQRNPGRAQSYLDELTAYCRKIALSPKIRRVIAHIEGEPLRKSLFGNYQIYYAILSDAEGIEVVHIRHGSRRDPEFMD